MSDYYEVRAGKAKEHMAMQRYIWDELWPLAEEMNRAQCWGVVSKEVSRILEYLGGNIKYFPNYAKHVDQWNALKSIADCRRCACTKTCRVVRRCHGG